MLAWRFYISNSLILKSSLRLCLASSLTLITAALFCRTFLAFSLRPLANIGLPMLYTVCTYQHSVEYE